jgi:hypothetical protein
LFSRSNLVGEEQPLKRVDSPPVSTENFVIAKRESNVARGELISLPSLSLTSDQKSESPTSQTQAKGF